MRKIEKTLTHKVGPFAVWVWALAVLVGVVIIRRRQQAKQGSEQQRNDRSYASSIQQPDLAFVPGGEIPVSPDMSSPSGGDSSGLLDLLGQIIAQRNSPNGQTETSAGKGPGSGATKPSKPRTPKPKPHHKVKLTKGARPAPSGAHKPTGAPPGYHAVGLGHGHWEWAPNPKTKPNPRSNSGWQQFRGGKPDPHGGSHTRLPKVAYPHRTVHGIGKGLPGFSKLRQRPTVPLVSPSPTQTQRPPASHTKHKDVPRPAPRPSSPPKRTMRTLRKRY